ncbi:MAG: SDR family NAD(P)-dependent oxidoreductase [Anaerovoracaceae bacterium]|jgi:3-oxoacyl-[acyl-carrier protein] reductase
MKVLITGSSLGIGRGTAERFLEEGHQVIGIDIEKSTIDHENYTHYIADVADKDNLPYIDGVEILINNAGVQDSGRDIEVNLMGTIYCTEKYGIQPDIKSIIITASVSAHNGAEFPEYCASKGGLLPYTKNVAMRVAEYGATCNSISAGGVITDLNAHILENKDLWDQVMAETLLPKWATVEEMADWAYFLAVTNKSMTAQDVLIDNGEISKANFVW